MFIFALSLQQWSYVGTLVTGLGVILVLFQVRQGRRNGQVELITGMTTLIIDIDRLFVEHPKMRKYFVEGAPSPERGTTEWERANAVAMAMANTLDHVVGHLRLMKRGSRDSWQQYIAEVHEKSAVFNELLQEHPRWWPDLQEQVGNR